MKHVLVTGASKGIGKACAIAFAKKGYHVWINCHASFDRLRETKEQIDAIGLNTGASCTMVPCDVSVPDDVRVMFEHIKKETPHLDVLINNAGISMVGLMMDVSDADWNRMIATNLSSAFYTSREALSMMVPEKNGAIINISSMWGSVGASCEVAYSAAKAGLNGLTRALAKEMAPSGISVNAIACGVIDTDMNSHLNEAERKELEEAIPAGRYAAPEEVADLVLSIAETSSYVTGQIIGIDGGYI